jgi:hypothetical protein
VKLSPVQRKSHEGEESKRQHQETRLGCCTTSQGHQKICGQKTRSQGRAGATKKLYETTQEFFGELPKGREAPSLTRWSWKWGAP